MSRGDVAARPPNTHFSANKKKKPVGGLQELPASVGKSQAKELILLENDLTELPEGLFVLVRVRARVAAAKRHVKNLLFAPGMCVCVCACVRACVHACVRACARASSTTSGGVRRATELKSMC